MSWGPSLWAILHTMAEKSGKGLERCRVDEAREMRWMVENLEWILPCQACFRHTIEYRRANPPLPLSAGNVDYKLWFWNFHEAVNTRLGKVGIPLDCVKGDCDIRAAWGAYKELLRNKYIILRRIHWDRVLVFSRNLNLWLGFLG
jgi:hypothetical protein